MGPEGHCSQRLKSSANTHLEQILREYVTHYNEERPHRGLSLETPEPKSLPNGAVGRIVRVARLAD